MKELNKDHEWRIVADFCGIIFESFKVVDIEELFIAVHELDETPYIEACGWFYLDSPNDGCFEIELDREDIYAFPKKFCNVAIKKEDIPEEVLLYLSMKWDI